MNKFNFLSGLVIPLTFLCVSCGQNPKPSPRVSVWSDDNDSTSTYSLSANKIRVPFERTDGSLAQIQISFNGVPFNMWWDTGASMTCISALELQKLQKEGKIKLDDYVGSAIAQIADGSTSQNYIYNIHEIYIPALDNQYMILHDVDAAVSPNPEAPLLIGQNIIQNLPQHTFIERDGVIEFEKE